MDLRLETFLPYRLNRAAEMSSRQFSHIYRHEFGLTVPEWRVLGNPGPRGTAPATGIGRDSAHHKTKVNTPVPPPPPPPRVPPQCAHGTLSGETQVSPQALH